MTENFKAYLLIVLGPLLGLLINMFFCKKDVVRGSFIAGLGVLAGFIGAIIAWGLGLPFFERSESLGFKVDALSFGMATLILFASGIIHHFSLHYMAGDRNYRRYFLCLTSITVAALLLAASDNIILIGLFLFICNLLQGLLMIHKLKWEAAKRGGLLAIKTFVLSLGFFCIGSGLLAYESKSLVISLIEESSVHFSSLSHLLGGFFIMLAALAQFGAWPFHRWLISSLNSPTPILGLIHTGFVSGGAVLLMRFSFVFLNESLLLNSLFLFGVGTLIMGEIWRFIQNDIKRSLSCSTMSQMGFLVMLCGLGLFAAALAHFFLHGLFKAFLFLQTGTTVGSQPLRLNGKEQRTALTLLSIFFCGAAAVFGFIGASSFSLGLDGTAVLALFASVAGCQAAIVLFESKASLFRVVLASSLCFLMGFIYGASTSLLDNMLAPHAAFKAQDLSFIYVVSIAFIFFIWLLANLRLFSKYESSFWWRAFYVRMLNASQAEPGTVTSMRNGYRF